MTIRTTNGETFDDVEHRALARLLYKRFGRDDGAFCAAWRRLLQNNAEDHDILKLLRTGRGQERRYLHDDLLRDGVKEARDFRVALLDIRSCEILRRHLRRIKDQAESRGQRQIGKAIARGMIRP